MPKMVREKMLVESKRLERLVTMAHNETTHDMAQQVGTKLYQCLKSVVS